MHLSADPEPGNLQDQPAGPTPLSRIPNWRSLSVCFLYLLIILFVACVVPRCAGYAVLTHEAIIDAALNDGIKPLLLRRFAGAIPEELQQAHAYAYGDAIWLPQQRGRLQLRNDNFDTGELTEPTAYSFTDRAYAELLDKVSEKQFRTRCAVTSSRSMLISGRLMQPRKTRGLGNKYSMR